MRVWTLPVLLALFCIILVSVFVPRPADAQSARGISGRLTLVQLRHDLLALRLEGANNFEADTAVAARASVIGRLVTIDERFVVLDTDGGQVWIPMANVLHLTYRN